LIQDAAKRGKAWNLPFNAIDPTAADDQFFYAESKGPRSLAIVRIEVSSTVAGNLEPIRATVGTPSSGSGIDAASLSGPGGNNPAGVFETGVDLQLTEGETLGHFYLAADTPRLLEVYYVIPPGTALVFNWEVATGILSGQATIIELAPDQDPVT
ncbi:hypothetical protein LCGC14_2520060, partial [marine sediment metagenome]